MCGVVGEWGCLLSFMQISALVRATRGCKIVYAYCRIFDAGAFSCVSYINKTDITRKFAILRLEGSKLK